MLLCGPQGKERQQTKRGIAWVILLTRKRHTLEALQKPDLAEMEETVPNDNTLNLATHGEARVVWVQRAIQVIIRHVREAVID